MLVPVGPRRVKRTSTADEEGGAHEQTDGDTRHGARPAGSADYDGDWPPGHGLLHMWRVQHVALKTPTRTNAACGPIANQIAPNLTFEEKPSEQAHVRRGEAIPCRPLEPDTSPL